MTYVEIDGRRWPLGDTIGSGGFARVHESVSPEGKPAVIKLIPKDRGAERELLFEELGDAPNVIPVLATGEHEDHWVLAMPRAEMSLRDYLNHHGRLEPDAAKSVLIDIARALAALDGRVVHRDLKPENVLCWNSAWCLADFGIARYAEQTTASQTRRGVMTQAYAAPEQWRFERATGATDIYSLGVMAHEMLSGARPFPGPAPEDYREQHLHDTAPPLPLVPPGLESIVTSCLMKAPGARPRSTDVLQRLEAHRSQGTLAAERLQQLNSRAVQRKAEAAAAAEAERTETERRQALLGSAEMALRPVYDALRARLIELIPESGPTGGSEWPFALEGSRLGWVPFTDAAATDWGGYKPRFDVVAFAGLEIQTPPSSFAYYGCSHSLWYCDAQEPGVFRWFETAFRPSVASHLSANGGPMRLPPGEDAGKALWPMGSLWDHVWPFTPIDRDHSEAFIERWLGWFADAIEGSLRPPNNISDTELRASYRT